MNPLLWFKPLSFIGLEIVEGEIRLLELKQKAGVLKIDQLSAIGFPKEAIHDGKIKRPQEITSRLKEWRVQAKMKNPLAAIALPSTCVIAKHFKMPLHWEEEEYEAEMTAHLNQHQPGNAEELSFDFYPLEEPEEGYQKVLIVAVRRMQLQSYVGVIQQAGFKVTIVDVDVYALVRAVIWGAKHSLMNPTPIEELLLARQWPIHVTELKNELRSMIQQQSALQKLLGDFNHDVTQEGALVSLGLALRGISG